MYPPLPAIETGSDSEDDVPAFGFGEMVAVERREPSVSLAVHYPMGELISLNNTRSLLLPLPLLFLS